MKNKNLKNNIINFPNNISESEREIEAILFAAEEPLDVKTIESNVKIKKNVLKSLANLKKHYTNRGINLICIFNKFLVI